MVIYPKVGFLLVQPVRKNKYKRQMKFLIQKINKEIRHDFSFTLIDVIRFKNWFYNNRGGNKIMVKYLNTIDVVEPDDIYPPFEFKDSHKNYVPIGSNDFVIEYLQHFYGLTPKPLNVPEELFHYAGREIYNGNERSIEGTVGKYFVKSNDRIKGYAQMIGTDKREQFLYDDIPVGNYQISKYITIDSEWRAFVYEGKLVGLQSYAGEFTLFPNVDTIKGMIKLYMSAPIAYTIDVGINDDCGTFVIECHDFFSVGLYGFNQPILTNMFYRWFKEYLKLNSK